MFQHGDCAASIIENMWELSPGTSAGAKRPFRHSYRHKKEAAWITGTGCCIFLGMVGHVSLWRQMC